jgi:hypothetical protein
MGIPDSLFTNITLGNSGDGNAIVNPNYGEIPTFGVTTNNFESLNLKYENFKYYSYEISSDLSVLEDVIHTFITKTIHDIDEGNVYELRVDKYYDFIVIK